jgi:hypothetical protein
MNNNDIYTVSLQLSDSDETPAVAAQTYRIRICLEAIRRIIKTFLQEKAVEATKQKEEKRKKPKPEEREGMPQDQHCPLEKRHGDGNP